MRGALLNGRRLLEGCTKESVGFFKLRGRISQCWHTAYLQADAFLINLRTPHFRPVALPGLLDYPQADVDKSLADSMNEVHRTSLAVEDAESEVKAARIQVKREQKEASRVYRWSIELVDTLGHLVDEPELVAPLPESLRKVASRRCSYGHRKKKEKPKDLSAGQRPETSIAVSSAVGASSDSPPEESLRSDPSLDLTPEEPLRSGPSLDSPPEESLKSGRSLELRVAQRRRGGKGRRFSSVRGTRTAERPSMQTDTPRTYAEVRVSAPPNAAEIRGKDDVCSLHEASLRGNRRPLASVRGGDRAKRRLLSSSRGVDRDFGGPERPANGGFGALGPWRERILGIFAPRSSAAAGR